MVRAVCVFLVVSGCGRPEAERSPVVVTKYTETDGASTTAIVSASPSQSAAPIPGCKAVYGDFAAAMRARDHTCVRSMLLPHFATFSFRAPEVLYLQAACESLGDTACERLARTKM